jgi:hypothetical protein
MLGRRIVGGLIERLVWRRKVLQFPVDPDVGALRDEVASLSQAVARIEDRVADLALQFDDVEKSAEPLEVTSPSAGPER